MSSHLFGAKRLDIPLARVTTGESAETLDIQRHATAGDAGAKLARAALEARAARLRRIGETWERDRLDRRTQTMARHRGESLTGAATEAKWNRERVAERVRAVLGETRERPAVAADSVSDRAVADVERDVARAGRTTRRAARVGTVTDKARALGVEAAGHTAPARAATHAVADRLGGSLAGAGLVPMPVMPLVTLLGAAHALHSSHSLVRTLREPPAKNGRRRRHWLRPGWV